MKKQELKLEWWKFIVGVFVAIVVALIPLMWNTITSNQNKAPQFVLSPPVFTADEVVTVIARNDIAQKEMLMDIEWDGLVFCDGAKPFKKRDSYSTWTFVPKDIITDKKLIAKGSHTLRFCFSNGHFSNELKINIQERNITSTSTKKQKIKESVPKKEEKVVEVKKVEREEVKLSKWITTIDGKMWQDEPYTKEEKKAYNKDYEHGKVLKWSNAVKYCKNLSLGGYSNWELPSKEELNKLYKNKSQLKNVTSNYYWSSTSYSYYNVYAWIVYFYSGLQNYTPKGNYYYVRCVRAGQ